jgi:hypothetical protein
MGKKSTPMRCANLVVKDLKELPQWYRSDHSAPGSASQTLL